MEDPEMFQGNFLFVNKNATNVKSRSADEAFTVGSHVCGKYARWRKVARVKPRGITHFTQSGLRRIPFNVNPVNELSERAIEATGRELFKAGDDEIQGAASRWRTDPASVSSTPRSAMTRSFNSTTSRTDEQTEAAQNPARDLSNHVSDAHAEAVRLPRADPKQYSQASDRKVLPSPRSILQKGNSDPFSAAVLPITPFMSFLINVWQGVYLETVWPVNAGATSRTPALLSWQNDCHDTIANKARLHGLLTWTLMLQISSLPESQKRSKLLVEYFGHKNKCLESLRGDLSRGASYPDMVPVLWHLTGAEFYGGHVSTATIHFTALKAMVESCGGLHALSWAMQKLVIVADMTLSQVKMEPLLFCVEQWDPGSIFPRLSHAEAEALALSPQLVCNSHDELPESVTDIFRDYRELLAVYELVNAIPGEFRRTELLCWAQLRQYALNSRVTKRRIDIASAAMRTRNRVSELCTCVAVDYFQQLIWHTRHKARTDHVPFHHPRPSFDDLLPNKDLVSPHLTAWIYFLAATVEQIDFGHGQQKVTGHAHRFFGLMKMSGLRSAQDLRRVFKDFLYHSETLDRHLLALLARAEESPYNMEGVPT
jgi:hypothetical protein